MRRLLSHGGRRPTAAAAAAAAAPLRRSGLATTAAAAGPPTKPVIGVVGVGKMGSAMAANILEAGVGEEVVVYDRFDRREVKALARKGARAASGLEEVGRRCSTVVTMLPNDEILTKCVRA